MRILKVWKMHQLIEFSVLSMIYFCMWRLWPIWNRLATDVWMLVVLRKLVIKKQRHEKVINLKNWFQLAMQSLYCERLKKRRGRKYVTPLEACGEWWQSMTAPMMCHGGMNLKEVSHATVDSATKFLSSQSEASVTLMMNEKQIINHCAWIMRLSFCQPIWKPPICVNWPLTKTMDFDLCKCSF